MVWWLLLAACETPTLLSGLPDAALAGDEVLLRGTGLPESVQVTLSSGADTRRLTPTRWRPEEVAITLPEDLTTGQWQVALQHDGWRAPEGQITLEVWHPDLEPPCVKRYALRTETSRLRRTIAIDRVLPNGTVQKKRFGPDEHKRLVLDDRNTCSALWLETQDGKRWLLADDDSGSLETHARAIADVIEIDLHVSQGAP